MCVCPELSTPKPLDQSKNVTGLITICERKKMDKQNSQKVPKKSQKEPKFDNSN